MSDTILEAREKRDTSIAEADRASDERLQKSMADHAAVLGECGRLKLENEALKAQAGGVPVYTKGMALADGGTYTLQDFGGTINVDRKRVTFVGGTAWPVGGPLFNVRPGADDFLTVNVRIHHPDPPKDQDGKRDVPAVMQTMARGATLLRCDIGTVGEIVKIKPPATRTLVAGCTSGADVYSAYVGCWGCDETVVVFNEFLDTLTENGVRFSPEGDKVPRGAVVAFNRILNPTGNKSAVDARHLTNGAIVWNEVEAGEESAAIGIANAKPNQPGVRNLYVVGNVVNRGTITDHGVADRLVVDDNVFKYATKPVNQAIYFNTPTGVMTDLRVTNNRIVSTVPQKPVVGYGRKNGAEVKPAQLDDRGNVAVTP